MVSYVFVGYDDYSVLQLCVDGPGEPGWFRWLKALMLELPFLLLPVFYIFTHNIIWFYVLSVWGAIYGC